MSYWENAHWESDPGSGVPKRDRRGGQYERFVPDKLAGLPLAFDATISQTIAAAERAVAELAHPEADVLASVSRFLLRSEAIASSRIEGVAPSPQQVALAELSGEENVRGVSEHAQLVANNMTIVRQATTRLVEVERVRVDDVVELHRALLPNLTRHHGLRTVQNWIGGSDWHPIGADFVPPAPERVPDLMADLVDFLNGAAYSPLVQAALVHAQFETIHPFTDGNGRVGRALIHTVLARRGLTPTAVLPVSLVLATLRGQYVDGLTSYRHRDQPGSAAAQVGIRGWLEFFVDSAAVAAAESTSLVEQIQRLRGEWRERVAQVRAYRGVRQNPRADSAIARLLDTLPEAPVLTASSVGRILDVSFPAANAALEELHEAEVLDTRKIERNTTAYLATEILDLVTMTERRLASTRFDTRESPPNRPVPARPQRTEER